MAVGLATAATLTPAPVAFSLVTWLHDANDRPDWWRKAERTARGLSRMAGEETGRLL